MKRYSADELRRAYEGVAPDAAALLTSTGAQKGLSPSTSLVVQATKEAISEQLAAEERHLGAEELAELLRSVEERQGEELTEAERRSALETLQSSLTSLGPLAQLVENPDINDIIVSRYDNISVQAGRHNVRTDYRWSSEEEYKAFIENLLKRCGKACTTATPVIDAALSNNIRLCVTHQSFSPPGYGPMLTLRIARHAQISLDELVVKGLAPQPVLDYLRVLVRDGDATVLIGGEVGTGKTTLIRALASELNAAEAVLVIEDTHEVALKRDFVRTLLTREANTEGAGRISPAQAIRTGMRMAMNRIILGEMRDGEAAEAFIDACASGHPGFSTIHARSAKDALLRLELFLARAQPSVSQSALRQQIANAVSVVIYLGVDKSTRTRRIMGVLEVHSSADGAVQMSPMFSYDSPGELPVWKRRSGISNFQEQLQKASVVLPRPRELISIGGVDSYQRTR